MPTKDKTLRESLESLRTFTPRLNAVTDLANDTVRQVEAFLNDELSVGIPAVVPVVVHTDEHGAYEGGTYLEYRRVGPKFRIAIVASDEAGEDVEVKPWSDSPRAAKLEAFKKLPQLLTEIAEKVEEEIKAVEAAAKAVAYAMTVLRTPEESQSAPSPSPSSTSSPTSRSSSASSSSSPSPTQAVAGTSPSPSPSPRSSTQATVRSKQNP